ncbi:LOW QUALITY PROTEIN: hypothetical protein Cgig2_025479 [Carnegiea gigantea]|uniref:Uncharacterized protein n=1 Tax=Carnegiea gigantea TaxID=171969 RepID=A0A9Q1QDU2_9CARY|nr:LOW QUALITY PROTEIN: hypothetical protein Cgig2_025479 [Carnegiea gigantea]
MSASSTPRGLPGAMPTLYFIRGRRSNDFELPEIVQATFYAMLLNDAVELGIVSGFMAIDLKATPEGFQSTSFESWLHVNRRGLLQAQLRQQTPPGGAQGPLNGREEIERKSNSGRKTKGERNPAAKYARENFLWSLRESSTLRPNLLPENHHGLCPDFDLLVPMWHAHALNDDTEPGQPSRVAMDCMMSTLRELKRDIIKS